MGHYASARGNPPGGCQVELTRRRMPRLQPASDQVMAYSTKAVRLAYIQLTTGQYRVRRPYVPLAQPGK